MKIGRQLVVPLLCMIVGIAMIVTAAGIVSNVAERTNHVTPKPIPLAISILDTTEIPVALGGDRPDWANGTMYLSDTVDAKVYLYASGPATAVSIVFQVGKAGVNATDVTIQWSDGVSAWTSVTWADAGDILTGTIGATGVGYNTGDDARYFVLVSFHVAGDYANQVWAEGS
jgi:hypothetical protein